MIVWKIALRNLREHKTKTIIVGVLIAIAMTILVAGNSFMDSIQRGMRLSYRDSYTGDVVLHGESDFPLSLFGVQGLDSLNAAVPVLSNYDEVIAAVEASSAGQWTPLIQGSGFYLHEEEGIDNGFFWGIEPDSYFAMFESGIDLIDGAFFGPRERAVLIHRSHIDDIEDETGVRYGVGDRISIRSNSSDGGIRIREVEITGIFEFNQANPLLEFTSLIDEATARELTGLDVEPVTIDDLSESERGLLGEVSDDDLFGGDLFGGGGGLFDQAPTGNADLDLDNILGDVDRAGLSAASFDSDRWHFLITKAPSDTGHVALLAELRGLAADIGSVSVNDWQWAAGGTITLVISLQVIFNVVVIVISIVSIIIIVNTLVISITERIPEIGTIRAIGGKRRFVRKLITRETLVITVAFGLIGIIVGSLIIGITAAIGIRSDSFFLQILLGSEIFRPSISIAAILSSLIGVMLMGWIASLYPVRMATRIAPVKAMQRG